MCWAMNAMLRESSRMKPEDLGAERSQELRVAGDI